MTNINLCTLNVDGLNVISVPLPFYKKHISMKKLGLV